MKPLTSMIIPTLNNLKFLGPCLESLQKQEMDDFEIIVVDNGSKQDIFGEIKRRFPQVQLIRVDHNAFFCESINIGIAHAQGEYIAVINDDTEMTSNWLTEALNTFKLDKDVGSVASKIISLRDKRLIDSVGIHLLLSGYAGNIGWGLSHVDNFNGTEEVFAPSAAGAVYKKSVLEEIGGFDEDLIAYYDDVDVGFRQQLLGYRCLYNPKAIMYHYGSSTHKATAFCLKLVERNSTINLLKNMPTILLNRYKWHILGTHMSPIELSYWSENQPMIHKKNFTTWLVGKLASTQLINKTLRNRKRIQANCRVSAEYIEALLMKHDQLAFHL